MAKLKIELDTDIKLPSRDATKKFLKKIGLFICWFIYYNTLLGISIWIIQATLGILPKFT